MPYPVSQQKINSLNIKWFILWINFTHALIRDIMAQCLIYISFSFSEILVSYTINKGFSNLFLQVLISMFMFRNTIESTSMQWRLVSMHVCICMESCAFASSTFIRMTDGEEEEQRTLHHLKACMQLCLISLCYITQSCCIGSVPKLSELSTI